MKYAVVNADIAPLLAEKEPFGAARLDEVLFGMAVEVLEEADAGWLRVRTEWQMEGWVQKSQLFTQEPQTGEWVSFGKLVARAPYVDVLLRPSHSSAVIASLPRGGLVHPLGEEDENGYWQVELPDGRRGYVKSGCLMPHLTRSLTAEERVLREALATSALSYLGTQYRSGGRSVLGIDAEGLVAMACLLNGIRIPRGGEAAKESGLRQIGRESLAMGDILYFEGHAAMYLGEGNYIHSTPMNGSDGVVINSLDAKSPFYREDLAAKLKTCASFF